MTITGIVRVSSVTLELKHVAHEFTVVLVVLDNQDQLLCHSSSSVMN